MDRTGGRRRHWRFVGSEGRLEDVRERPRPRPRPRGNFARGQPCFKKWNKTASLPHRVVSCPPNPKWRPWVSLRKEVAGPEPTVPLHVPHALGTSRHVLGWPVRGASTRRQQMGTLSFLWVVAQRRLCRAPGDKGGPVQRNTGRAVLRGGRPASGAAAPASPAGGTAGPEEPSRRLFVLQPTHPSILASSSVQDPKGRGERTQPGHPRMSL